MQALAELVGIAVIIIILVSALVSGAFLAATGDTPNVGITPNGGITLQQAPDPDNQFHRPMGELMGLHQDAQGHWSR